MALDQAKIKRLRGIGHKLKPIVTIAENGLSEGVIAETDRALNDHELIKVTFTAEDREVRRELARELLQITGAKQVQAIGKILLIYRPVKKPNKRLSNLHRHI